MKILSWFDIYFQGFSRQDFHQRDRKEKQGYKIPLLLETLKFIFYFIRSCQTIANVLLDILIKMEHRLDREEDSTTEWYLPEFFNIRYFSYCKYLEILDKTKPALFQKQDCPWSKRARKTESWCPGQYKHALMLLLLWTGEGLSF